MFSQKVRERHGRRRFFRAIGSAIALMPFLAGKEARAMEGFAFDDPRRRRHRGPHHCLLRGTAILTDRGPIAIERLEIGDLVLTNSGAFKKIIGIGRNTFGTNSRGQWDANIAPVCITRSAISDGVPQRNLYLSPHHAVFIDGYLVPARYLVNDLSIVQGVPQELDILEYFHVECEQHEVIYAEGAAVESLRLTQGRETYRTFTQYSRDDDCRADAATTPCAPLLGYNGGRQQAAALARLAIYPWFDVRDRIQTIHDRLTARAKILVQSEKALAA